MDWLLAFDNGVKDRFGGIGKEGVLKAQLKWDWLIGECTRLIPGFNGDYTTIDTPAGLLEQIRLGNLIDKLPQEHQDRMDAYFPRPQDLYRTLKNFQQDVMQCVPPDLNILGEAVAFMSREILVTMEALRHLFLQVVDRKEIIAKSADWRRENPCHEHAASSISGTLEDWEKELEQGDKGHAFEGLVKHLAWHVLMTHIWLVGHVGDGADIEQLEHDMLLRLVHSYLMQMQDGANLSGARLFARLERLGFSNKNVPKKQWSQRPNLFKGGPGRELLDGDLAEFLVTGFVFEKKRRPLRVITCDRKDQEKRLKAIILGVKYVNKILNGMEGKAMAFLIPERIPIVPGAMILVDKDQAKPSELIDVQKLIEEVEAENEVAPPEIAVIEP